MSSPAEMDVAFKKAGYVIEMMTVEMVQMSQTVQRPSAIQSLSSCVPMVCAFQRNGTVMVTSIVPMDLMNRYVL